MTKEITKDNNKAKICKKIELNCRGGWVAKVIKKIRNNYLKINKLMYKNHQIFAKKKKKILMLRLKQEIKVSPDFNRYMQHDQQSLTLNLNSLYF